MLVSVIIPTRDRAEYLRHSLATALNIKSAQAEILVSNNASADDTHEVVQSFNDTRLRYLNTGSRLSMRQNFEFALEESRGDYVIFIGDDDSILPGQFDGLCKVLESLEPDGLSWDYPVYGWPGPNPGPKAGGFRIIRNRVFGQPEALDLQDRSSMLSKGQLYQFHPVPGIYHACMSRTFIKDKLAAADGTCILARSPDTYMSMRALQYGGRFVHCKHPFSMNGFGTKSTGGSFGSLGRGAGNKKLPAETQFEVEIKGDPVEDVMPISKSMALGFLSTLETVRHHFPDPPLEMDYLSWYRTVLHEMRKKNEQTSAHILKSMMDHAASSNSTHELQQAQASPRSKLIQAKSQWHKNADKLMSFRVSGKKAGTNTVATAVEACDMILGTEYEQILDGQNDRRNAWSAAKARYSKLQQG